MIAITRQPLPPSVFPYLYLHPLLRDEGRIQGTNPGAMTLSNGEKRWTSDRESRSNN